VLGVGLHVGVARADGDPASDVLVTQSLFLPSDARVSARVQSELEGLLSAAQHDGYPVRVAVLASPADMGSVGELWRHPQGYAGFLGEELSLLYHGTVLAVMPNGVGVFDARGVPPAQRASVAGIVAAGGSGIGVAAIVALQDVASAAGYRLVSSQAPARGRLRAAPRRADAAAWIAFVVGALMLAGAWTASVRARPLRVRGRAQAAYRTIRARLA
jgi:hypothetical protein